MKATRVPVLAGGDIILSLTELYDVWAVSKKRSRRAFARRMDVLERVDREAGVLDWLLPRAAPGKRGSKKLYNLSRLERRHPEMFRATVKRDEFEKLVERVDFIERQMRDRKATENARGAFVRSLKERVDVIEETLKESA